MPRLDLPRLFAGSRFSVAAIVLGNLVPVFGVAFLGWDGAQILILYWFENLIVGALTLPRILSARGRSTAASGGQRAEAIGTGCFFMIHYGIFCLVHGAFALALANDMTAVDGGGVTAGVRESTIGRSDFWWTVLAIAVVHLIMHIRDWWLAGAWRGSSPMAEMFRPYGRIFVLHLTVLGGAWLMAALNAPSSALLILCFGKMALELVGLFVGGRIRGATT